MDRRSFLKSILAATGMGAALAAGLPLPLAIEKLNKYIRTAHPAEPSVTSSELGAILMAVYLPRLKEDLEGQAVMLSAMLGPGKAKWKGTTLVIPPVRSARKRKG